MKQSDALPCTRAADLFRIALVSALLLTSPLLEGHELEADKLTVVLRDAKHLSLTFSIDDVGVMHRMLSPRLSATEFLLSLAAMDDGAFSVVIGNFRKRFEQEVGLKDATQGPIPLVGWHWPDIAESRKRIRQLTMQGIVGDGHLDHLPPTIITVDALSRRDTQQVELLLPAALEGLLVVHYRPSQQVWRPVTRGSLDLRF